jgi:SPP1 gp7 family putative phage head morphogenesis protein
MKRKRKLLAAINPNEGLIREYQSKLDRLIDEMQNSLVYWLSAAYKANKPEMAQDISPAAFLTLVMKRLAKKWNRKFAEAAVEMAAYYMQANKDRTDAALKATLKKAGFAIEFKVTPVIQDILTAAVNQNVSLIKTIASEHLSDVNEIVMRSVMAGRDLGGLREELQNRYGITKRRASLIARTSNNQASAEILRARAERLGIEEAQWVHSNAGKEPRPEHVHWSGTMFNMKEGKYSFVSKKYVWPGTDFNCRCSMRLIAHSTNIATRTNG